MKCLIYDENTMYAVDGNVIDIKDETEPTEYIQATTLADDSKVEIPGITHSIFKLEIEGVDVKFNLDPTMMKRIAVYNKEVEVKEKQKELDLLTRKCEWIKEKLAEMNELIEALYELGCESEKPDDDECEDDWYL